MYKLPIKKAEFIINCRVLSAKYIADNTALSTRTISNLRHKRTDIKKVQYQTLMNLAELYDELAETVDLDQPFKAVNVYEND